MSPNGEGGEYVTRWQADKMMSAHIDDYELKVGGRRHEENGKRIDNIIRLLVTLLVLTLTTLTGVITVLATRPSLPANHSSMF